MIAFVSAINAEFVQEAHTKHTAGGWSWMRARDTFQTKDRTTLNGAISAGALSFILTAVIDSNDTSGKVVIETAKGALDFVDWSSNSSTTYTVGTEPISIAHADSEKVEKLYKLPTDYAKTQKLFVGSVPYFPKRDVYLFPSGRFFTIQGDYIMFPKQIGQQDVTHFYSKKPTALTAKTDETNIPKQFERWAIEMTLFRLFRIRRKRDDLGTSLQLAQEEMNRALEYDKSFYTNNSQTGLRSGFF